MIIDTEGNAREAFFSIGAGAIEHRPMRASAEAPTRASFCRALWKRRWSHGKQLSHRRDQLDTRVQGWHQLLLSDWPAKRWGLFHVSDGLLWCEVSSAASSFWRKSHRQPRTCTRAPHHTNSASREAPPSEHSNASHTRPSHSSVGRGRRVSESHAPANSRASVPTARSRQACQRHGNSRVVWQTVS